jgi:hypothetical protein
MLSRQLLHTTINRPTSAMMFCCALTFAPPAFSQEARADQAVELLRLAIQCPTPPQQEFSGDEVVGRITNESDYLGDRESLKILTIQTKRHHDRSTNRIIVTTEKLYITTKYSDLVGVAAEATFFWTMLISSCRDKLPCVTIRHGTTSSSESESVPILFLSFCDKDTLKGAKSALQELISFNAQKRP